MQYIRYNHVNNFCRNQVLILHFCFLCSGAAAEPRCVAKCIRDSQNSSRLTKGKVAERRINLHSRVRTGAPMREKTSNKRKICGGMRASRPTLSRILMYCFLSILRHFLVKMPPPFQRRLTRIETLSFRSCFSNFTYSQKPPRN